MGCGKGEWGVDNRDFIEPKISPEKAIHICDRNFGVGPDGVIFVLPGFNGTNYTMRIFNSDGSEPEARNVEGAKQAIDNYEENNGYMAPCYEEEESSSGSKIKMKLKEIHKSATSFTALDKNYLIAFFTSQNGDEEDEEVELLTSSRWEFVAIITIHHYCQKIIIVKWNCSLFLSKDYSATLGARDQYGVE
ncbi:hypothetical protein RIF29_38304 [Crotalaria pallida]|uniref:Uncharacterized protein n=1 Tax=Crotalaria pallida TaxID=3830 RepID=A0AAN9E4H1_CROPI